VTPSYRAAVAADRAFIVDSWVESYRHAHAAGFTPMPLYQRHARESVNWYLDQPGVEATVAELDGMLAGFCAADRTATTPGRTRKRVEGGQLKWVSEFRPTTMVLYLYVKDAFRRHGIGFGLMAASGVSPEGPFVFASKTPMGDQFLQRHGFVEGRWRPLDARFPKTNPLEK
jgi:GNAT superfamily N-acetyltransferase